MNARCGVFAPSPITKLQSRGEGLFPPPVVRGREKSAIAALLSLALGLVSGCIPQETKKIGATDTLSNIPAIQDAARQNDRNSIPALVKQLESDDGAVRFYAITSLYKLTNQTLGYRYYDDSDERQPAVERWKKWLATQPPLPNKQ